MLIYILLQQIYHMILIKLVKNTHHIQLNLYLIFFFKIQKLLFKSFLFIIINLNHYQ